MCLFISTKLFVILYIMCCVCICFVVGKGCSVVLCLTVIDGVCL